MPELPSLQELAPTAIMIIGCIFVWFKLRGVGKAVKADITAIARAAIAEHAEAANGDKRILSPQPFEVKPHVRLATHEELTLLSVRVLAVEQRIEAQYKEIGDKAEVRGRKLHERIDALVGAVGELRGEIKRLG